MVFVQVFACFQMSQLDKTGDECQHLLGSIISLVPLPKIILLAPPVFTHHEAPQHKLKTAPFINSFIVHHLDPPH